MSLGVLVVGHGSREPQANEELRALVAAFRARVPAERAVDEVAHAFVELASPFVDEALPALAARHETVVVLPLFLFLVGHAKNDLPIALHRARAAHPRVTFLAARELGAHPLLLELLFERAAATLLPEGPPAPERLAAEAARTVAVVVARG